VLIESSALDTLLGHCVAGCEEYLLRAMSVSCHSNVVATQSLFYPCIATRQTCLSTCHLAGYRVALRRVERVLGIAIRSKRCAYRGSNTLRQVRRRPELRLVPITHVSMAIPFPWQSVLHRFSSLTYHRNAILTVIKDSYRLSK
jgi:hypothetical protein